MVLVDWIRDAPPVPLEPRPDIFLPWLGLLKMEELLSFASIPLGKDPVPVGTIRKSAVRHCLSALIFLSSSPTVRIPQ